MLKLVLAGCGMAAVAALGLVASAQPGRTKHESAAGVKAIDTSIFAASGMVEGAVVKEAHIAAPRTKVYEAMTTSEGTLAYLGVENSIELRIGGPYELYFGRGRGMPEGQQGTEGCQILSYVPNEMLSFSWNAPPTLPEEREKRTWVVVTFTDAPGGGTDVRLVHTGFGSGGRWSEVHDYFDQAWPKVLGALQEHFGDE